ncbi:MAG: rod shape-determining protein MreC [Alphaproteobacteria bacterium]|nr:rod shape-determining protein MreC [Alphaproteobacteria bacterium]
MATKSTTSRISNRLKELARAGATACLLPIFFLYILLDKPDYKIMNAVQGVVVPVAKTVGDGLSWPFRTINRLGDTFRTYMRAVEENEELRARLNDTLRNRALCDIALLENQRLEKQLDIVENMPQKAIVARVIIENSAFRHTTLIISKGEQEGIQPGQAVVSMDGNLVGIIADSYKSSARVRGLEDAKSNIPVRVAGSNVYGFIRGNGDAMPSFEFFSDQEFIPTKGIRLVSSGVNGNLPNGIPVGIVSKDGRKDAKVTLGAPAGGVHEVMVLMFDAKDAYK